MTTGPMGFRKAVGFRGPIEMTLRNQHVRPEDLFFSTEKTVRISVKTFFWRSHHNSEKNAAFSLSVLEFTKPEIRLI